MRILYPIRLTSLNNDIVTTEGTFEIPAGIYYAYDGSNADYPSLFDAIRDADLFGDVTDTVEFSWSSPSGYGFKESLTQTWVTNTAASANYLFGNGAFTFPPELLGFPSDIDVTVVSDGSNIIEGTRSTLGAWIPGTIHGGGAQDQRSTIKREVYASTDPIYKETKIIPIRERRNNRVFRWEFAPGLRVQGGSIRGDLGDYRETAGAGEITDGLADDGDELSLRPFYDRVSGGQTFLVLYGDDDQIELTDGLWEAVRISELSQMQDFEEWYDMTRPGGEFYDVGFDVLRVDGEYDY